MKFYPEGCNNGIMEVYTIPGCGTLVES